LSADLAAPVGLVLHELATNAVKHGALSSAGGTVRLRWSLQEDSSRLRMTWDEQGGPAAHDPSTMGLGSVLIDRGIPGAVIDRHYLPEGLSCTITFPLKAGSARRAS
jgi:two-component system CheB/CheR fusion protein